MARIAGRIEVSTCIACGARTRLGGCPDGCAEVAVDLVEAVPVDALDARVAALGRRVEALRAVALAFAEDDADWEAARRAGHAALRVEVPDRVPAPDVVEAWGCPECGRVDAPQPCLDVCIRRPVEMMDASAWAELADRAKEVEADDRALSEVVGLIVHVKPRPGHEERSRGELVERVRAVVSRP